MTNKEAAETIKKMRILLGSRMNGKTQLYLQYVEAVDKAIKALTAPQVGKWVEYVECGETIYFECSCCYEPWTLEVGTPEDNNMYYCPNCGALMEETIFETEEDEADD